MKIRTAIIAVILLALLSACNNPVVIPADLAVTLPPNQDYILRATLTDTPGPVTETPTPTKTLTPTPSPIPTQTATPRPIPTRALPYPAAVGTPVIDMGFPQITIDQAAQFRQVFSLATNSSRRGNAVSADGQKLFLSTSQGIYLFNRTGEILAHWIDIVTPNQFCETCLSTNQDGSRLAVIVRNAGIWEARVYDIQDTQATLELTLPVDSTFQNIPNEASIAISPDNALLAFHAGGSPLRVIDLKTNLQVLNTPRQIDGTSFSPDGKYFVLHSGQELVFYKGPTWNNPSSLLLPNQNTPYAFSPDGKLLAIALSTLLRVYSVDGLKTVTEINVPPSNAVNRVWQIAFKDATTLTGYAVRWDTYHTTAVIESGQWDVPSRKTLNFTSSNTSTPDGLSALWGNPLSTPQFKNILETDNISINGFHFISDGILLINSVHGACWVKIFTGESTCYNDPQHNLFASDSNVFKEVNAATSTSLNDFHTGKPLIQVGPYSVAAINRTSDFALIDTGQGTDLYKKAVKLPQESVKGVLAGFAENAGLMVISSVENANNYRITVVDKTTGNAIYQLRQDFLYKPVVMTQDGMIYYTEFNLTDNQTAIISLNPKTHETSQVAKLYIPAETRALALSRTGLFAIGQNDGSVLILSTDGTQSASLQAAASPIQGLDFSPDGRFLAVASQEGISVFAIVPGRK